MTLLFGLELIYMVIIFFVCLRVINDTQSTTKTLAYLLLVIFIPFLGVVFYLAFGIYHRSSEMYSKKLMRNDELADKLHEDLYQYSIKTFNNGGEAVRDNNELAYLLFKDACECASFRADPWMGGSPCPICFSICCRCGQRKYLHCSAGTF
jgi:cardiolipin synthase